MLDKSKKVCYDVFIAHFLKQTGTLPTGANFGRHSPPKLANIREYKRVRGEFSKAVK
jgi:hypothetical protein